MATTAAREAVRRRPIAAGISLATTVSVCAAYVVENDSQNDNSLHLPRSYDAQRIQQYWRVRPISVASRIFDIVAESAPIVCSVAMNWNALDGNYDLQRSYAAQVKDTLTRLGPAFVKIGQQISIRPDLVPPPVLSELQKLCDSVEPVSDEIALGVLRDELNVDDFREIFDDDVYLVASASLGQVYKTRLEGEAVAIKVQRPDMLQKVSLDLYLLHQYANFVDKFTSIFTEQPAFHEELIKNFAAGSYSELDYEREAANQKRFKKELGRRKCKVKIPKVYDSLTTRRVITTEWIDGVKLANAPKEVIKDLIPVGVELFLTQLLDVGAFHADPHPGNLYVTSDGNLCLLDFGLVAEVDSQSQEAMTAAIVHLISGDFGTLVSTDAKKLGFLPVDMDTRELQPILTKILTEGLLESGSNLRTRSKKLMQISSELNEVFFKYPFSVPPFFALVTRGLGLLEGIALSGDPNFDIFQASYPYARRRAVELFGVRGLKDIYLERMKGD
mmetsp:Transcript_8648/g.12757  ORF Transcript_8648/g.12757 Transcript_8648/m.12757 type:complete len:502 (+) Transcript_8648:75-1580(+)